MRLNLSGERIVSSRLDLITDWPERARKANWCVQELAEQCRVSARTLERHIRKRFGFCPHGRLVQLRMQQAVKQLLEGFTVKETAFELGYKNPHHFSREFKNHFGHPPSQLLAHAQKPSGFLSSQQRNCRI